MRRRRRLRRRRLAPGPAAGRSQSTTAGATGAVLATRCEVNQRRRARSSPGLHTHSLDQNSGLGKQTCRVAPPSDEDDSKPRVSCRVEDIIAVRKGLIGRLLF